jgi:hypothetical protein
MRVITILAALMFTASAFACGGEAPKTAENTEASAPVAADQAATTPTPDQAEPQTDDTTAPKKDEKVAEK